MAVRTTASETTPPTVKRLLEPGEQVLWHGRERAYNAVLECGIALIGRTVVPLTLLLLIWSLVPPEQRAELATAIREAAWTRAAPLSELRILALLLAALLAANLVAGVVAILLRLGAAIGQALRTRYAVTDRRVLIVEGGHAISVKRLPFLRIVPGPLGDDLLFGTGRMRFACLADAETVKRRLLPFLATREMPDAPWGYRERSALG